MTAIQVLLHMESNESDTRQVHWWAESPDVAGWTAGAKTLAELTSQVSEGLEFYHDGDRIEVSYVMVPKWPASQGPSEDESARDGVPTTQGLDVSSLASA